MAIPTVSGRYVHLTVLRGRSARRRFLSLLLVDFPGAVLVSIFAAGVVAYAAGQGVLPQLLAAMATMAAVFAQFYRSDRLLLRRLNLPFRAVALTDSLLIVVPAGILLLAASRPPLALAVLLAPVVTLPWAGSGNLVQGRSTVRHGWISRLPAEMYEWRAGLRRSGAWLVFAWGISIWFSGQPVATGVGTILLAWIISTFFFLCESDLMIEVVAPAPRSFLRRKVSTSVSLLAILLLPLALAATIRSPESWFFPWFALWVAVTVHIAAVVQKYALFQPGKKGRLAGPVGLVAASAAALIPPVVLLLIVRWWSLAERRLGERGHA